MAYYQPIRGWGSYTSVSSAEAWGSPSSALLVDDGINIGYVNVPTHINVNVTSEFMEISSVQSFKKVKRVSLFGEMAEDVDEEEQSIIALKWIKDAKRKLTKEQQEEYKQTAELAFQEAVKNMEMGMDDVARKFEKVMNDALKNVTPASFGYDTYITNHEVNAFRKHLPKRKELVIDEIDEYEKPLPREAEKPFNDAKKAGCFEKFVIFWIREVKDPILFGLVKDQPDRFYFITEWDDDVSINDFLKYKK